MYRVGYEQNVERAQAAGRAVRSLHPEMYAALEVAIPLGHLDPDCWQHDDWRDKLDKLVEFISIPLDNYIISNHIFFTPEVSAILQVFTASRIMEELDSTVGPTLSLQQSSDLLGYIDRFASLVTPTRAFAHCLDASTLARGKIKVEVGDLLLSVLVPTDKSRFDQADAEARAADHDRSKLPLALEAYQLASLIDSSNVAARLNAASIRLRMADDASQCFQSVLIISHLSGTFCRYFRWSGILEQSMIVRQRSTTDLQTSRPTIDVPTLSLSSRRTNWRLSVRSFFPFVLRLFSECAARRSGSRSASRG